MRMTRAALRAQEAEEELHTQIDQKLREQGISLSQSSDLINEPLIHEDEDGENQENNDAVSYQNNQDDDNRQALRDITMENYPTVDGIAVVFEKTEVTENNTPISEIKGGKKARSKKGKKTTSRKKDITEDISETLGHEANELVIETSPSNGESVMEKSSEFVDTEAEQEFSPQDSTYNPSENPIDQPVDEYVLLDTQDSQTDYSADHQSGTLSQRLAHSTPSTPSKLSFEKIPKTPRFDPAIHVSSEQATTISFDTMEDSFVESIKTRSPSKHSQSVTELQSQDSLDNSFAEIAKHSPVKTASQNSSPSRTRIEDSMEAIDALEEAIEKFAEDLPVIQALPFESPVRSRKTPARTPAKEAAVTPGAAPKFVSKTPSKAPAKSPMKTPAKLASPAMRTPSSQKAEVKTPPSLRGGMASVKRETVKDRVKAIESKPTPAPHRRATSVHVLKKEAPEVKQTLKSKQMAEKLVPTSALISAATMSFSNSPVKPTENQQRKRVTSGGVLVTSRPGFVPAKSSKPTTTSTFSLPGEAIAAKLKAQREERLKKEESEAEKKTAFKARPAPTRTARPSVMPRENKASTARMNVRQASGENKENVAPARPTSTTISSAKTSASTSTVRANSSVRRTTIAPKSTSTVESRKCIAASSAVPAPTSERIASLSNGQQITLSKTEVAQQKLKGKEVYGRIKGSIQQQDGEKKAKEEAARKARAEAAERGRQASREWAEKQKKKMAIGTKTIATDVEATH